MTDGRSRLKSFCLIMSKKMPIFIKTNDDPYDAIRST